MVSPLPFLARAVPTLRGGLSGAALCVLAACASPNLQHAVLSAVERGAEPKPAAQHALALQAREGIAARYARGADAELQARLAAMAQRLGRVADPQNNFTFEVVLLKSDTPMVFSAGDGTIYVTTRAATLLSGAADQMAFAIAHEIAHVMRGDTLAGFEAGADVASEAIRVAHRGYAPYVESLADELALQYLAKAGYDPALGAGALATVRRHQRRVDRFGTLMHGTAVRKRQRLSILSQHTPTISPPQDAPDDELDDQSRALPGDHLIDGTDMRGGDAFPELAP